MKIIKNGYKSQVRLSSEIKKQGLISKEQFTKWITANREKDPEKEVVPSRFGNTGVSVPTSIKCLHGHTAVYLAGFHFSHSTFYRN
jgi:hypothetical protein